MAHEHNTIIYAALAVMLLVVLGSSFYSFSQFNALNTKIAQIQPGTSNDAQIAALTTRVQALEDKITQLQVTAKVILFYDSSCTFCDNQFMLQNLDQTQKILASQGIGLQTVDIKDNPNAAAAVGVKNAPVFFAGATDLSANSKLVEFFNTLPKIQFSVQETATGLIAYPPVDAEVIENQSCAQTSQVSLEEFYSATCAYCRPVNYANGTRYNNASKDFRFSILSGDAAQQEAVSFGNKIKLTQRCINVHTLNENKQVLKLNSSDEGLCISQVGSNAYKTNEDLADQYGISGAPTFVIDCKYITKLRDAFNLQKDICKIRPELCQGLAAPTPIPTLPPEIAKALTGSGNASK